MDVYINIKPFERLQTIQLIDDGFEIEKHYVFLDDIPDALLHDYKEFNCQDFNIHLVGSTKFNSKFKNEIGLTFKKEYGKIKDNVTVDMMEV